MRTRDFTRGIDPYLADRIDPDPEDASPALALVEDADALAVDHAPVEDFAFVRLDANDLEQLAAIAATGRHPRADGRAVLLEPDGPWRD